MLDHAATPKRSRQVPANADNGGRQQTARGRETQGRQPRPELSSSPADRRLAGQSRSVSTSDGRAARPCQSRPNPDLRHHDREAIVEAIAGVRQGEEDRAPYCTPTYAAMEAGASWVLLGHPKTAIPILEKSRSEWLRNSQVRDYAMCVSRLAAAYAAAGEPEQACTAVEEVLALAHGLGSRRVAGQIDLVYRRLGRWQQDPAVASTRGALKVFADSFKPEREAS